MRLEEEKDGSTLNRGTVTILKGRKKRRSKATVIAGPGSEDSVWTGRLLVLAAA